MEAAEGRRGINPSKSCRAATEAEQGLAGGRGAACAYYLLHNSSNKDRSGGTRHTTYLLKDLHHDLRACQQPLQLFHMCNKIT